MKTPTDGSRQKQTLQYFAADIAFDECVKYVGTFLCDMLYNTTSVFEFCRQCGEISN
jgi:hypothetical protein